MTARDTIILKVSIDRDEHASGDLDDSCAFVIEQELIKFKGVERVKVETIIAKTDQPT
jgi:hypothetical protein